MPSNINMSVEDLVLNEIRKTGYRITTRKLSLRLRQNGVSLPSYKINRILRELYLKESIARKNGKWYIPGAILNIDDRKFKLNDACELIEKFSDSSDSINEVYRDADVDDFVWNENVYNTEEYQNDGWDTFRRLVKYYRACVLNEESSEAYAYIDNEGDSFLYFNRTGLWYPAEGRAWRDSITLSASFQKLVAKIPQSSADNTLILGYPLDVICFEREGEPPSTLVQPVFFYPLRYSIRNNRVDIVVEENRVSVNMKWLESNFRNNSEKQRSFLSAANLMNFSSQIDAVNHEEESVVYPDFASLAKTLSAFFPKKIVECLTPGILSTARLTEPLDSGLYNRAVVMIANKTTYTATLLKELAAIAKAPKSELDKSALRDIFYFGESASTVQDISEFQTIETSELNVEQKNAVSALLNNNLVVITGPPGTGKSQVVAATIKNIHIYDKSVLFSSRNHKALDAVVPRTMDREGRLLIARANSKEDPNIKYDFSAAISDLLEGEVSDATGSRLNQVKNELLKFVDKRASLFEINAHISRLSIDIAEVESEIDEFHNLFSYEVIRSFSDNISEYYLLHMETLAELLYKYQDYDKGWIAAIKRFFLSGKIRKVYEKCCQYNLLTVIDNISYSSNGKELITVLFEKIDLLKAVIEYLSLRIKVRPMEAELKALPDNSAMMSEINYLSEKIEKWVEDVIELDYTRRSGLDGSIDRAELGNLKRIIKDVRLKLASGKIESQSLQFLRKYVPLILAAYPSWAVTSLSVGSKLPLLAGEFDLVIIDESSQSDIASAIPLLFRSKRAGVVGDPLQLTAVRKLSEQKDLLLRRQLGLDHFDISRFSYKENSLYDLCSQTNGVHPVMLCETYRSIDEIAQYSNSLFYNGRLRVGTDESRLSAPEGIGRGISWTDVTGEVNSAPGGGCYCDAEVDEVVTLVRTILLENNYQGTLGVVTPFAMQKKRIQDVLLDGSIPRMIVESSKLHIDTVHGFQGDERDVIIFSLCAGSNMPRGSVGFLRNSANLFNVAASRARIVFHIIGNKCWAEKSDIVHIRDLTRDRKSIIRVGSMELDSPWAPHESPWEKILYEALFARGIQAEPQLKVSTRRLDLGLVREGCKIDIEVDGNCHRNNDGTRKEDDIFRDIQLQGLGWKVMRFWVYQLREDLDKCIDSIVESWREHE